eukprot:277848_1
MTLNPEDKIFDTIEDTVAFGTSALFSCLYLTSAVYAWQYINNHREMDGNIRALRKIILIVSVLIPITYTFNYGENIYFISNHDKHKITNHFDFLYVLSHALWILSLILTLKAHLIPFEEIKMSACFELCCYFTWLFIICINIFYFIYKNGHNPTDSVSIRSIILIIFCVSSSTFGICLIYQLKTKINKLTQHNCHTLKRFYFRSTINIITVHIHFVVWVAVDTIKHKSTVLWFKCVWNFVWNIVLIVLLIIIYLNCDLRKWYDAMFDVNVNNKNTQHSTQDEKEQFNNSAMELNKQSQQTEGETTELNDTNSSNYNECNHQTISDNSNNPSTTDDSNQQYNYPHIDSVDYSFNEQGKKARKTCKYIRKYFANM